ncbi:RNA polymerase sigma factor [Streptomyces sp. MNU89]|uniref:RNA polymerase sigma factor n=1 Tax=Streptomyces sp. MNU89 TaxID=2560025 RepID=UPI001E436466|nr:sigma-70 family RNA polymerase sigma factor [Streptomyces sp. MNU89]MCC9739640.1 sigma-70 family RNA polymerase sigma factor [Streptomyces sp. MNU89]
MATDRHPADPAPPGDEAARLRWQRMWGHREHLLKVARRRSMSAEDAEDAVQEAMLRGAQNAHLDDARMGAWLTTVTMRLCVDRYRQVHREAQVSGTRTLTAPGPVPVEEAVCDRAEAKWLAYRSEELPARQAEAIRLKSQDLDVGQIAREMDLSYEAVESLLARARRTLRKSLAGTLAFGLWLIGRHRDGGQAPALVAASAAATLAVVGLAGPFPYEPDTPRPPRPAMSEPGEAAVGVSPRVLPADASPPAPSRLGTAPPEQGEEDADATRRPPAPGGAARGAGSSGGARGARGSGGSGGAGAGGRAAGRLPDAADRGGSHRAGAGAPVRTRSHGVRASAPVRRARPVGAVPASALRAGPVRPREPRQARRRPATAAARRPPAGAPATEPRDRTPAHRRPRHAAGPLVSTP